MIKVGLIGCGNIGSKRILSIIKDKNTRIKYIIGPKKINKSSKCRGLELSKKLKCIYSTDRNKVLNSDVNAIILRLPSIIGKGSHSNFLSNILLNVLNNQPIKIINPNAGFNNAVYVDDLCEFICLQIMNMDYGLETFTISSSGSMTILEIVNEIYRITKVKPRLTVNNPDGKSFMVSNKKIQSFGFQPRPISETINIFVRNSLN